MGFMVRHWSETAKFTDAIRLDALERVVPYELIRGSAEAAAVRPPSGGANCPQKSWCCCAWP